MLNKLLVIGSIVLLIGCENVSDPQIDAELGNSVRQNIALQTLNPDAGGPDGSTSIDGQRAEIAVDRMRERSPDADTGSLLDDVGIN